MLRLSRWIEFSATSLLHLQVGDDKIFRGDSYIAANRHRIAALNPPSQLVIPKKHAKKYDADWGGGFFFGLSSYFPLFALPSEARLQLPMAVKESYEFVWWLREGLGNLTPALQANGLICTHFTDRGSNRFNFVLPEISILTSSTDTRHFSKADKIRQDSMSRSHFFVLYFVLTKVKPINVTWLVIWAHWWFTFPMYIEKNITQHRFRNCEQKFADFVFLFFIFIY